MNGVFFPVPGPDTNGDVQGMASRLHQPPKVIESVIPPLVNPGDIGSILQLIINRNIIPINII